MSNSNDIDSPNYVGWKYTGRYRRAKRLAEIRRAKVAACGGENAYLDKVVNAPLGGPPYCLIPPCHCIIQPDADTIAMIADLRRERELGML